jgi:mannose-6-phosphate isomerase-like protein (cupin superfamily)
MYKQASLAFVTVMISAASVTASEAAIEVQPMVVKQVFEEAKKNNNWKTAFATGKEEQIVFMSISPATNPKNEIGTEVHPFDQVILIVQGNGNAIINGKQTAVTAGDMIFIPKGIQHNVVNLGGDKELKLISFYSETDIPKGAAYKMKSDQPARED